MSLFTAKGKEAKESAKKKKVDLSKAYIKLKDGESVRVRLLGVDQYVEYRAHGSFAKGIYTTADISGIIGRPDPYTVAANSGVEGFEDLYAKKRYLFAFADIDSGEIRVFDASKNQGENLMNLIDEFEEVIEEGSNAFTFKRTGNKVDTNYNLIPIMKLKKEDQDKFNAFEGVEVPEDFFESVLIPRTEDQMIEALQKAGFPTAEFFVNTPTSNAVEEIGNDETKGF